MRHRAGKNSRINELIWVQPHNSQSGTSLPSCMQHKVQTNPDSIHACRETNLNQENMAWQIKRFVFEPTWIASAKTLAPWALNVVHFILSAVKELNSPDLTRPVAPASPTSFPSAISSTSLVELACIRAHAHTQFECTRRSKHTCFDECTFNACTKATKPALTMQHDVTLSDDKNGRYGNACTTGVCPYNMQIQ